MAQLFAAIEMEITEQKLHHLNLREGWRGHLWQERFHSCVMDEQYLLATVRYTELNPVRAGLCTRPEDWIWSSTHAHLKREDDMLVTVNPMLERVSDWPDYLKIRDPEPDFDYIRKHARTGRPIGGDGFISKLEQVTGRRLVKARPGPKPDNKVNCPFNLPGQGQSRTIR